MVAKHDGLESEIQMQRRHVGLELTRRPRQHPDIDARQFQERQLHLAFNRVF